jgi:hypothetical protein
MSSFRITSASAQAVLSLASVFLFCFSSHAQTPLPNTDIYLVGVMQTDSGVALEDGRLVTRLKRYDDQPSFSYDSQYMFYASESDDYKTDAYAVYIPQFQNVEYIATGSVSEYYPQQRPNLTGLAVITGDPLNDSRQVWFYATDASPVQNLTPDNSDVQRFIWLGDSALAYTTRSNELYMRNLNTFKTTKLASAVGPCIQKVPSENAVYCTANVMGVHRVMRISYDTGKTDSLLYLPGGSTEFCVAVDGSLWAANEGIVYRWPRGAAHWETVKDFGNGALGKANRVAISRDMKWLALVSEYLY